MEVKDTSRRMDDVVSKIVPDTQPILGRNPKRLHGNELPVPFRARSSDPVRASMRRIIQRQPYQDVGVDRPVRIPDRSYS